ncbi:hypothetical protein [uncultured Rhodospira sp.]|uniref:hypothetical protein n=1 Tax=uncultured Rhodospira sp. TaxID=1936189 RepID=UPI0026298324|nr:hypothetical protein [uncultured Rhodospira sp.]
MENRITRLEVEQEHVRRDLDEIKGLLKDIGLRLARMPTVGAMWGMVATVIGVALSMIGITVAVIAYLSTVLAK